MDLYLSLSPPVSASLSVTKDSQNPSHSLCLYALSLSVCLSSRLPVSLSAFSLGLCASGADSGLSGSVASQRLLSSSASLSFLPAPISVRTFGGPRRRSLSPHSGFYLSSATRVSCVLPPSLYSGSLEVSSPPTVRAPLLGPSLFGRLSRLALYQLWPFAGPAPFDLGPAPSSLTTQPGPPRRNRGI